MRGIRLVPRARALCVGADVVLLHIVLGMAQASKAILPKDPGGPWGQRIGVSVGGSLDWALVVSAFKTARLNSADWNRYSIVSVSIPCGLSCYTIS